MIDLKRILDRTETAEPKYMLRGEKNGSVVKTIWKILVYINQTSFFSKRLLKIWTSLMCFLNLQDGNSAGLPSHSPIMWVGQLLLWISTPTLLNWVAEKLAVCWCIMWSAECICVIENTICIYLFENAFSDSLLESAMARALGDEGLSLPPSFFPDEETGIQDGDPESNGSPDLNMHEISPYASPFLSTSKYTSECPTGTTTGSCNFSRWASPCDVL